MVKLTLYTCVNDAQQVRKRCATREKEMGNTLARILERVENDSQTGEKNWANLLERIRYNKSSGDITMSSRS